MCGLLGFYGKYNFTKNLKDIDSSLKTIKNRGPDDSGKFIDTNNYLVLGHTRLSIIDISNNGSQPMISFDEQLVIVFNGEIYNYIDLRKELKNNHIFFKGHSDTETLLGYIAFFGLEKTLKKIKGMFVFCLWNKKDNSITIVRDSFGEKPLYYSIINNTLFFSSDIITLFKSFTIPAEIDANSLSLFLKYGYINEPNTIFKKINKLKSGNYLTFKLNNNKNDSIYSIKKWNNEINFDEKNDYDENTNINNIENLLYKSIESQLISDVPLGVLLSGGIDSSLITSISQNISKQKIKTFTVAFEDNQFNESLKARKIADYLDTDHTSLLLLPNEALDIIPKLSEIYTEPFADSSQVPQVMLSKHVKQKVSVVLSGDGADELFGGYNRHIFAEKYWSIYNSFPKYLIVIILKIFKNIPVIYWDLFFNFLNKLKKNNLNFIQIGDKIHKFADSILYSNNFESLYDNLTSYWINPKDITKHDFFNDNNLSNYPNFISNDFKNQMMLIDTNKYLKNDILCKTDRASMYYGLESRAPFLDKDLSNYAFSIPNKQNIKKNKGKIILRKILNKYLPKEYYDYPKQGFSIPLASWIRGPLKSLTLDTLNSKDINSNGFFNNEVLNQNLNLHFLGKQNLQNRIWPILIFQLWFNKYKKYF